MHFQCTVSGAEFCFCSQLPIAFAHNGHGSSLLLPGIQVSVAMVVKSSARFRRAFLFKRVLSVRVNWKQTACGATRSVCLGEAVSGAAAAPCSPCSQHPVPSSGPEQREKPSKPNKRRERSLGSNQTKESWDLRRETATFFWFQSRLQAHLSLGPPQTSGA